MADKKKNKPLFGGFDRLQGFPLDPSSVFDTWGELEEYRLYSKIAYHGQLVVCLEDTYDHYGAYILQEKGNGATSYLYPYKLSGTREFTDQIGTLRLSLADLEGRITNISDEELATIKAILNEATAWIKNANENGKITGDPKFAYKTQLEELKEELNKNITKIYQELYGDEFLDRLNAIEQYGSTIDSIYTFIEEHGDDFSSIIQGHGNRLQSAEDLLINHNMRLTHLEEDILDLATVTSEVSRIKTTLDEYDVRLSENERKIQEISTDLKKVEYVAEYKIDSLSPIAAPEFTTDTVIDSIEIVITETGATVPGGIFTDNTKMYVDFVSSTNPQNVHDIVVPKDEIYITQGVKIILDVDYQPFYLGCLRFVLENSEKLSGYAYVRYHKKAEEPAQNGGE